jgi:uncharacterized membrane protein YjjB (DUF3815 family)
MLPILIFALDRALWGGLGALGFAFLFNVPHRVLLGCALCGALGVLARTLLIEGLGATIAPASLVGAALVGMLAIGLARLYRVPALIFSVCGAIPLVPGSSAFRAMIALLQASTAADRAVGSAELYDAATNMLRAILVLVALAFGIALPTLIFGRKQPVV